MNNNERLSYVDNLKGLAILLVVIGHVFAFYVPEACNEGENIVHRVIYSFHMPLFMALSGYVAKFTLNHNLFNELLKKFRTLMLPWLIMSTVYIIFQYGIEDYEYLLSLEARKGYWFLVTLFTIHFIVIFINGIMKRVTIVTDTKIIIVYLVIMLAMFYIIPKYVHDASLCNLHRMMVYFLFGRFLRNIKITALLLLKNDLVTFIAISLYMILMFLPKNVPGVSYIQAMMAVLFLISIEIRIYENSSNILNNVPNKIFEYMGRKSLAIYVLHYFFFINMPLLNYILFTTSNFAISFSGGLILSILVIFFVLITEKIISLNKYLKLICLGKQ